MIDDKDIARLDERYVRCPDCAERITETRERIQKTEIAIGQIGTKLNIIIGILAVIGTAIVGAVVSGLFK